MLKEIGHVLWNAPRVLALRARLPQDQLYNLLMARADAAGLADRRAELVRGLSGRILEVGCGTGLMFQHYPASAHVTALDPDETFLAHAQLAARNAAASVSVQLASGEALAAPDASFDAAVIALVLCSVPEPARILAELARVLTPGGELRLLEHVRSERPLAGWLMDRVDGPWLKLNGQGCHLNRDPLPALATHGFDVVENTAFQVFSSGLPAFPMRLIRARRRP